MFNFNKSFYLLDKDDQLGMFLPETSLLRARVDLNLK